MILKWKKGNGIKLTAYFNADEFSCKCDTCEYQLIDLNLVDRLTDLRKRLGKPIHITSGYRCESHNKNVSGHPNSKHMTGYAVDFTCEDLDTAIELAEDLFMAIGDGRDNGSFIHVDMREDKQRRWNY